MFKERIISNNLRKRLLTFQRVSLDLIEEWEIEDSEVPNANYPFEKSFDEVVSDINDWIKTIMYETLRKAVDTDDYQPLFLYKGIAISNPFISDNGLEAVDPIDYYGIKNIRAAVRKITVINDSING